jgi:SAM-dependent methyltransferase
MSTSSRLTVGGGAGKSAHRAMWAMGDYDRFARATVWELGPVLVDACGIRPGDRVLDVAAGTGNVAIRAAMKGASVVACDLTPEHSGSRAPSRLMRHPQTQPAIVNGRSANR